MNLIAFLKFCHLPTLFWISMKFGLYVQDIERDVPSKCDQDHSTASWVISKYFIVHAQVWWWVWHFRFLLVLGSRAYIPNLVKFCPVDFEWHISCIFDTNLKSFGWPLPGPDHSVKFHDDWTKSQRVMANILLSPAYANFLQMITAMFFDRSW